MAGKLKLGYFEVRGRGEFIRYCLVAGKMDYVEDTVKFGDQRYKTESPFGTLPYLTDGKLTLGQTIACAMYVAEKTGFAGKDCTDRAKILEIIGLWEDELMGGFRHVRFGKDEEKAPAKEKALGADMKKYFKIYNEKVQMNGFLIGDKLSLGDFYIYDMIHNVEHLKAGGSTTIKAPLPTDALKDYPNLQRLVRNVESNPEIKAYQAKRPPTYNGY